MVLRAHLGPADTDGDLGEQRGSSRRELRLETIGTFPEGSLANVTVHNISSSGMLLETSLSVEDGELLSVELPDVGAVEARVVWVSGSLIGCVFENEIGAGVLAASQLRADAILPETIGASPMAGQGLGSSNEMLGPKLHRLRREKGLTLAQVAEHLGVSKPTVWAWEKGKARPLPDRLDAIADVLGVEIDELTGLADPKENSALVEESRIRIATAFGTTPAKVRIMIEL